MTLGELQQAILKLSAEERGRLRDWLAKLDEPSVPEESTASRFGRLAGRALADLRKKVGERKS